MLVRFRFFILWSATDFVDTEVKNFLQNFLQPDIANRSGTCPREALVGGTFVQTPYESMSAAKKVSTTGRRRSLTTVWSGQRGNAGRKECGAR